MIEADSIRIASSQFGKSMVAYHGSKRIHIHYFSIVSIRWRWPPLSPFSSAWWVPDLINCHSKLLLGPSTCLTGHIYSCAKMPAKRKPTVYKQGTHTKKGENRSSHRFWSFLNVTLDIVPNGQCQIDTEWHSGAQGWWHLWHVQINKEWSLSAKFEHDSNATVGRRWRWF